MESNDIGRLSQNLEADVIVGDFRIEQRLGAGGMGVVYRARQVSLDRIVALKVLGSAIQTAAGIARFRREAQAVAKLKHPGIAGIYFIGQDEQICYLAMEYVEGVSFRAVIRKLQSAPTASSSLDEIIWSPGIETDTTSVIRFDIPTTDEAPPTGPAQVDERLSSEARQFIARNDYLRRVVELVRDIALALAYAHEQGVVHRDIKPENLLLDQAGKATIIDFGLAQFYDDETITYTGQLIGTPLYMSPEQILGQRQIDGRTDVYSLGMVLYELLTLAPPLNAPNRESLFRQIAMRPLPPINWKNSAVSEDLAAVVHHALAKDPDERYATMAGFAADLARYLSGKPVAATPYRYRLDEREIIAQRPGAVLYLAFYCFFIGFLLSSQVLAMAAMRLSMSAWKSAGFGLLDVTISLTVATIAVLLFIFGRTILLGRSWGRWLGLGLGALFVALTVAFSIRPFAEMYVRATSAEGFAEFRVQALGLSGSLFCGLQGTAFLVVLLHPRVKRWFRFAAESREAFRRERQKTETS